MAVGRKTGFYEPYVDGAKNKPYTDDDNWTPLQGCMAEQTFFKGTTGCAPEQATFPVLQANFKTKDNFNYACLEEVLPSKTMGCANFKKGRCVKQIGNHFGNSKETLTYDLTLSGVSSKTACLEKCGTLPVSDAGCCVWTGSACKVAKYWVAEAHDKEYSCDNFVSKGKSCKLPTVSSNTADIRPWSGAYRDLDKGDSLSKEQCNRLCQEYSYKYGKAADSDNWSGCCSWMPENDNQSASKGKCRYVPNSSMQNGLNNKGKLIAANLEEGNSHYATTCRQTKTTQEVTKCSANKPPTGDFASMKGTSKAWLIYNAESHEYGPTQSNHQTASKIIRSKIPAILDVADFYNSCIRVAFYRRGFDGFLTGGEDKSGKPTNKPCKTDGSEVCSPCRQLNQQKLAAGANAADDPEHNNAENVVYIDGRCGIVKNSAECVKYDKFVDESALHDKYSKCVKKGREAETGSSSCPSGSK